MVQIQTLNSRFNNIPYTWANANHKQENDCSRSEKFDNDHNSTEQGRWRREVQKLTINSIILLIIVSRVHRVIACTCMRHMVDSFASRYCLYYNILFTLAHCKMLCVSRCWGINTVVHLAWLGWGSDATFTLRWKLRNVLVWERRGGWIGIGLKNKNKSFSRIIMMIMRHAVSRIEQFGVSYAT